MKAIEGVPYKCKHKYERKRSKIPTVPSVEAEARRVVIHWHIDSSVTSPSCLPTNWTPSISLSMGHLSGSSAENPSPFPTFVESIFRIRFPIATTKISCVAFHVDDLLTHENITLASQTILGMHYRLIITCLWECQHTRGCTDSPPPTIWMATTIFPEIWALSSSFGPSLILHMKTRPSILALKKNRS